MPERTEVVEKLNLDISNVPHEAFDWCPTCACSVDQCECEVN